MKKILISLVAIGALITFGLSGRAEAVPSIELALVMDGSSSMSPSEWALQLQGYANAITDPHFVPQDGSVAIGVVQFSSLPGSPDARQEIAMTLINSQAGADALAANILLISQINHRTNISDGIYLGEGLFGLGAEKLIIDVTTDGRWNEGIDPLEAAMDVVDNEGVWSVNALGIGPRAVLGFSYGTNSFEMTAANFNDFDRAIRRKIRRELGTPIPEPATMSLLGMGILGLFALRKKRS